MGQIVPLCCGKCGTSQNHDDGINHPPKGNFQRTKPIKLPTLLDKYKEDSSENDSVEEQQNYKTDPDADEATVLEVPNDIIIDTH